MTIAGGPNPTSNQVSLESNAIFFSRVLDQACDTPPTHRLFFADGKIDQPDLQFNDEDASISAAATWMNRRFG